MTRVLVQLLDRRMHFKQQAQGVMSKSDSKLVAFAVETGLRREEQFRLRWDQVDLERGSLALPVPKEGTARHVLFARRPRQF